MPADPDVTKLDDVARKLAEAATLLRAAAGTRPPRQEGEPHRAAHEDIDTLAEETSDVLMRVAAAAARYRELVPTAAPA